MRELETERLLLRRFRPEDAERIYECWASDAEVTRYLSWFPHESPEQTARILGIWLEEYDRPETYRWGIELRSEGRLIGMIDVVGYHRGSPVLGYCSGRAYWGRGYMTEALGAVTDELFRDGFDTIVIEADTENVGSNRVIEKNGFQLVSVYETPLSEHKPEPRPRNSYRKYKTKREA